MRHQEARLKKYEHNQQLVCVKRGAGATEDPSQKKQCSVRPSAPAAPSAPTVTVTATVATQVTVTVNGAHFVTQTVATEA